MIETCTKLELLQYLYNELDESAIRQIKADMEQDPDLRKIHRGQQKVLRLLDAAWLEPRQMAVEQILAYSRY
jgi:hypothetical protein